MKTSDNPTCQHFRVDNDTARCVACGEQMVSQSIEAETVLSAPNAAGCTNPACLTALEDGTYDDADPPAGCTNTHGLYVPDPSRQKEVIIGYKVTYECERCGNNGTIYDSHGVTWECGKHHRGDTIQPRAAAGAQP